MWTLATQAGLPFGQGPSLESQTSGALLDAAEGEEMVEAEDMKVSGLWLSGVQG